jgi:NAD-dependent SIR2 family protein deacetylase
MKHGGFVFTSNVDGKFQKAGFDAQCIVDRHGTMDRLQCVEACTDETSPADDFKPAVNETTCQLENDMPRCAHSVGLGGRTF